MKALHRTRGSRGDLAVGLFQLHQGDRWPEHHTTTVGETPVTIFQTANRQAPLPRPSSIAHGFAGSQQLMQPFAETLARNGYIAVTFDFLGHGRNPAPMRGDITEGNDDHRRIAAELTDVAALSLASCPGERRPACGARPFDGFRHRGAVCAG